MILFLDDSPERCKKFRSRFPSATIVNTAAEAIIYLDGCLPFDEVWLDHDLGGAEHVDGSRPDTGSEVVRWIIANQPEIGKVIIHSLNHDKACRMHNDLTAAGYSCSLIPFTAVDWNEPLFRKAKR